ncbi:MAG: hypothetical protein RR397_08720 [Odoribacter sp.]
MLSLLLSTFAMMGLTFAIGFFVAGVIKIIANWADFFDFYGSYRKEMSEWKQTQMLAAEVAVVHTHRSYLGRYKRLTHRVAYVINGLKPRTRIPA